jgi:type II secretory pathway component HofQ
MEVINQLSSKAELNIVAESNLTGNITGHLTNVPIDDAVRSLFLANNFNINQDAGIYTVGSKMAKPGKTYAIYKNRDLLTIEVKNAPALQQSEGKWRLQS